MYEFWYDYVKPKYGKKVKIDSFIVYIKTDDEEDVVEDFETRFATSNNELESIPLTGCYQKEKIKK